MNLIEIAKIFPPPPVPPIRMVREFMGFNWETADRKESRSNYRAALAEWKRIHSAVFGTMVVPSAAD